MDIMTKVRVLWEDVKTLRDNVAELATHALPGTGSATPGQILKLNSDKEPTWADEYSYTPPGYSITEPIATGETLNGKPIYKLFSKLTSPASASNSIDIYEIGPGKVILDCSCFTEYTTNNLRSSVHALSITYNIQDGSLKLYGSSTTGYNEKTTYVMVAYCEDPYPSPEPEPETKTKTRKTTKKEDK